MPGLCEACRDGTGAGRVSERLVTAETGPDEIVRAMTGHHVTMQIPKQPRKPGKVKLEVTISPDGRVTSTKVVGGSPLLVGSAMDAIKKWRFESAPKESSEIIEFDFN